MRVAVSDVNTKRSLSVCEFVTTVSPAVKRLNRSIYRLWGGADSEGPGNYVLDRGRPTHIGVTWL